MPPRAPTSPIIGEEVFADDELVEVFAGHEATANVLFVDSGVCGSAAPRPCGTSTAGSLPPSPPTCLPSKGIVDIEGLQSSVAQTYRVDAADRRRPSGADRDRGYDRRPHRLVQPSLLPRTAERGDRALPRPAAASSPLLFCDLDNFRSFNELHGHGAGDRALRAVARVIEGSVRHVDLAARFGGEEFATILIDTGEQGALEVAERIRAGITATDFAAGATSCRSASAWPHAPATRCSRRSSSTRPTGRCTSPSGAGATR